MRVHPTSACVATLLLFGCSSGEDSPPTQERPGTPGVVPAGPFMMGCNSALDGECDPDEQPYHQVTLPAFAISITEITIGEYAECVSAGACAEIQTGLSTDPKVPISSVTWDNAGAYCAFVGMRLPTEAEWEKAARGTEGRVYPWGNTGPDCSRANSGTCGTGPKPVGDRAAGASPYGVLDMAGNVSEWVADWYDAAYYSVSPATNPLGPDSGSERVVRDGAFRQAARTLRASNREPFSAGVVAADVGFRCAQNH